MIAKESSEKMRDLREENEELKERVNEMYSEIEEKKQETNATRYYEREESHT